MDTKTSGFDPFPMLTEDCIPNASDLKSGEGHLTTSRVIKLHHPTPLDKKLSSFVAACVKEMALTVEEGKKYFIDIEDRWDDAQHETTWRALNIFKNTLREKGYWVKIFYSYNYAQISISWDRTFPLLTL